MSESPIPDNPVEYLDENLEVIRELLDHPKLGPQLRKLARVYDDRDE